MFEPILPNRRIFEEVSDRIKQMIFDGKLKPGDRLPSESELATQFDVSRPTIREALRLLEVSGFISIQKGAKRGQVISDTIFHRISQLYLDAIRMRRISLPELTMARIDIEKNILNQIFNRRDAIDSASIDELKANLRKANQKVKKGLRPTEENLNFHRLLAQCAGNHVYVIIVESLMAVLGDMISRLAPDVEAGARVVAEHEKILEAIIAGNRERTLSLMQDHLLEVESRLTLL